jgi:hypothetical protein
MARVPHQAAFDREFRENIERLTHPLVRVKMTPVPPFLRGAMVLAFATGLAFAQPGSAKKKDTGTKITLEFPKLPKDRRNQPARTTIWLPKDYRPERVYPLYVWLRGSDGDNHPGTGQGVVNPDKFVQLGLPYPNSARDRHDPKFIGNFPEVWKYHRPILEDVLRAVPNVHPRLRVVAGFSNGGHCIDGLLSLPACEFRSLFNVFILADGGEGKGDYRGLQGSFAYVCWGEKGLTNKEGAIEVVKKVTRAKMTVKAEAMKGIGHEFPPPYRRSANHWLETTVLPVVAKRELALALAAERAGRVGEAMQALRGLETMAVTGYDARVKALGETCETRAATDWQKLEARFGSPPSDTDRKAAADFRRRYAGTRATDKAAALALPLAQKQFKAIKVELGDSAKRKPALARLRQLEQDWTGTALGRECWKLSQSTKEKK